MKLISANSMSSVELLDLRKNEVAFPNIEYRKDVVLHLPATTLRAAYTTIVNQGYKDYLDHLEWDNTGDIVWQNLMLANLESVIASMINAYLKNQDDELLIKIFVTIQLWGGNAGRGILLGTEVLKQTILLKFIKEL